MYSSVASVSDSTHAVPLSSICRMRLCTSDKTGKSAWLDAALGIRDKMANIPIVKVRDMTCVVECGVGDPGRMLSPAERACQKGEAAVYKIADTLISKLPGIVPQHKVLVFDMRPQVNNEWALAIEKSQQQWAQSPDRPLMLYAGAVAEEEARKRLSGEVVARLMKGWWPAQPGAILAARQSGPAAVTVKPTLELLTWVADKPQVPPNLEQRFDDDSQYSTLWAAKLEAATSIINAQVMSDATTTTASSVELTPDFSGSGPGTETGTLGTCELAAMEEAPDVCPRHVCIRFTRLATQPCI